MNRPAADRERRRPTRWWVCIAVAVALAGVPLLGFAEATQEQSGAFVEASSPEQVGMSSERLDRLDAVLQGFVDRGELVGVAAIIGRRGKIAYTGTFGMADREASAPMRADTLCRIASMTKAITTVAVMMLYEEGHLKLKDPISRYIPEFAEMQVLIDEGETYSLEPANKPITIHHLLTHTSGIAYRFYGYPHFPALFEEAGVDDGLSQSDGAIGDAVKKLAGIPLRSHPGEAWEYGLNTDVLGYLVEVISGMTLAEFMQKRIFEPLGMNDTFFYVPQDKVSRLSGLYGLNPEGGITRWPDEQVVMGPLVFSAGQAAAEGQRSYYAGGANLVSTAENYARSAQMLLGRGELDGARLLSSTTVDLMTSNHIGELYANRYSRENSGDRWGLGFAIRTEYGEYSENGSIGTYGWCGFYNTTFWVNPEEEMFGVFMTQMFPTFNMDSLDKFRILAHQAIVD